MLQLNRADLTGSPEEQEAKYKSYCDVVLGFNENIATMYMKAAQTLWDNPDCQIIEATTAAIITLKVMLDSYITRAYPKEQEAPTDLRNLGYYLEQCMAQLSYEYTQLKKQEVDAPPLILT